MLASGEGRRSSNGINWRWLSLNQKIGLFLGNLCGLKLFRHLINHEPKVECFSFFFHLHSKVYQYSEAVAVIELEKEFCTLPKNHFFSLSFTQRFSPMLCLNFAYKIIINENPEIRSILSTYVFVCVYMSYFCIEIFTDKFQSKFLQARNWAMQCETHV